MITETPARRVRARSYVLSAAATAVAVILSSLTAAPAIALEVIQPPVDYAIVGDLRVGETVEVSSDGWTPADVALDVTWVVEGVPVTDATEAEDPLDLTLRAEWLGQTVAAEITASAEGHEPLDLVVTGAAPIAEGEWAVAAPEIAGSGVVGQALDASVPALPDGVVVSYRWLLGSAFIPGATAASYTPTAAQIGQVLSVRAAVTRAGYRTAEATSLGRTVLGAFTTAPTPTIVGTVRVGVSVTAQPGTWAPSASFEYLWTVNGVPASSAASFTIPESAAGKNLALTVTGSALNYASITRTSASVPIGWGVFSPTVAPKISGAVRVGNPLTASAGTFAPTASLVYAWKVGGVTVSTSSKFTPTASHLGKSLTLTVTASRTGYTAVTKSTVAVKIGYGVFAASTPRISGAARVGSTLKAVVGVWTPTPALRYQWLRNGAAIKGATASSYRLTSSDWTKRITVRVTASKTAYTTASRTSVATAAVTKAFLRTTAPSISGTARVGYVLAAKVSGWSPTPVFSYQWKRNGVAIVGATRSAYRLTSADYGKLITVTVTGKRAAYTPTARTSVATAKIAGPKPVIVSGGMYRVGTQIKPGTYVANAKFGCYWERRSDAGSGISGVIANDFVAWNGRVVVTISSSDVYFSTDSECGAWTPLMKLGSPASSFGDGVHVVGTHIRPGLYVSNYAADGCYWAALSGFGGTLDDIIENDFTFDAPNYVRIYSGDAGFLSSDCGKWTRIGD